MELEPQVSSGMDRGGGAPDEPPNFQGDSGQCQQLTLMHALNMPSTCPPDRRMDAEKGALPEISHLVW